MSAVPSASATPWRDDAASSISFQELSEILNSIDWESMNFGDNFDEPLPVIEEQSSYPLTQETLASLSVSNGSFTPNSKSNIDPASGLTGDASNTLENSFHTTASTVPEPAILTTPLKTEPGTAVVTSGSKSSSTTKKEKKESNSSSSSINNSLLHRQLYMRTAPLFQEVLSYVHSQHQLILPRLTDAPHILRDIDIINHDALQALCTRGSPEYVVFIQMLESITEVNASIICKRETATTPAKEKKKMSKAKFFEHLYFVVPVHNSNARKEDRHARNAIRLLLAGFALAEMHQTSHIDSMQHQQMFRDFTFFYERLSNMHADVLATSDITDGTILRIYVLFREVFQIIPLRNNLELCFLLLSVVEAAGVHRQRGGHMTKADNLYRDVLESIAIEMNVI